MWLSIEDQGVVAVERIVAISQTDAAPVRRLLEAVSASQLITLTGGRKRQSAIILDSNHIVLTALTVKEILQKLEGLYENGKVIATTGCR